MKKSEKIIRIIFFIGEVLIMIASLILIFGGKHISGLIGFVLLFLMTFSMDILDIYKKMNEQIEILCLQNECLKKIALNQLKQDTVMNEYIKTINSKEQEVKKK